ncbi:MAG: hypothetical protein FJZ58_06950, partial [Chlamydiae bacterium]|nr:hypothetical protein [Chlamydiota bacterium]
MKGNQLFMIKLLFFMFTLASSLYGLELGPLYQSLDPLSITENAAFAELYPDSPEGELAKNRVWSLLFQDAPPPPLRLTLPFTDLQGVVSLISKHPYPGARAPSLSDEQLALLQAAGQTLHHHKLLGSKAFTEEEILRLPPEEIDVARAVLLCQFPSEDRRSLLVYEASLDLMALQIRARLPLKDPSPEEILYQMNQFIFQEMGFRFPPRSVHIQDIDLYTFLPSVLDSRRGVCLGVSILFFSLAQRLGLPLEVITPPGHIYLRYLSKEGEINIETTARGIHIPTDHYLGINTRSLPVRTPKEVVGLALINQASVCWGNQDYKTTVALYEQAKRYLPDDPLLSMLLGLNYLFLSEEKKGKALLASLDPLL